MQQYGIMAYETLPSHTHLIAEQGGIIYEGDLNVGSLVKAYINANQVIPSGVRTKILFNAEIQDTRNEFDADGVDSVFTCVNPGVYQVTVQAGFSAQAINEVGDLEILRDAVRVDLATLVSSAIAGAIHIRGVLWVRLAVGEALSAHFTHNAGVNRNLLAGDTQTFIDVKQIGV